jgi:hypothetical protein
MTWPKILLLSGGLFGVLAIAPLPAWGLSPEQAASYCYDQAKKMGFSSRDMEERSWEDCMGQFRRQAQPAAPSLSPQERAVILQHLLSQPAPNPGTAFGAGVQRGLCNSQGGYFTPDGQCVKPPQPPSYRCWQVGNTTDCTPY